MTREVTSSPSERVAGVVRKLLPVWLRWGPLFVVALVLGTAIISSYINYYASDQHWAGFAQINRVAAGKLGLHREAIPSDVGYDGQYYFFMAYAPASVLLHCKDTTDPACTVTVNGMPELRAERILYPMTVRILSFGQLPLIPIMMLLVNVFAILIVAELVGQMAVAAGASRWWGAAAALYCGMSFGLLRDLADPFAVMWLVLTVFLLRQERWRWAALAGAAALLTRESLIFFIPLFAIPLVAERRWSLATQYAAIALGPFIAWQIVCYALFGKWAILTGDSSAAHLVHIPFIGLWHERKTLDFSINVLGVMVPLLAVITASAADVLRQGWRLLLRDALPLTVILYGTLLSFTYWFQWADVWGASRLAAPAVVLGTLVALRQPWVQWRSSIMTMMGIGALIPLIVAQR